MVGWRYNPRPLRQPPAQFMLAHSRGVEYAKTIRALDFSVVDPFSVWSVHADYNKHQVCIGRVRPVSRSDGDAVYAVGANSYGQPHYVNGTEFLPGVVRNRLVDFADCGEFATYHLRLPCVTVKPVRTVDELPSLSKPA